jgi:Yip1 domain
MWGQYGYVRACREVSEMSLIECTKQMLLHPKAQWEIIASEPASTAALYTRVVMPLAAIGPVATLIGWSVLGVPIPLAGTYRVPLAVGFTSVALRYVLGLGAVFVLAMIIDALAPSFGGQRSQVQALKVATFSSTAAWLAGIFSLIPSLNELGMLGLYSLYLLYAGLPIVMKAPADRALGYTIVVIVCAVVLFFVIRAIAAGFVTGPDLHIAGA